MAGDQPYLNRGSYKWIPDDFGATSGSNFGVLDAYYQSVINFGRPQNVLPRTTGDDVFTHLTDIFANDVWDASTGTFVDGSITSIAGYGESDENSFIAAPFLRYLMRSRSQELITELRNPEQSEGIGISSTSILQDGTLPFFFFSTEGVPLRNIASITVEYALMRSSSWTGDLLNTPLSIIAVYDSSVGTGWLNRSGGSADGFTWGPPVQQQVESSALLSTISNIGDQFGWSGLAGAYLPQYTYDANGVITSLRELNVTHEDTEEAWDISTRRIVNVKMSGDYWTIGDAFPRLKGILIAPSGIVLGSENTVVTAGERQSWNAIISGIRIHDALPTNLVPEHEETFINRLGESETDTIESQLPCKIFGYAWRISHAVVMSKDTLPVQPSLGTTLTGDGSGVGSRGSTFRAKFYHPDVEDIGFAHGVRFYYGLAVSAIPGTSPLASSFSLVGILTSLTVDMDLLMVQYFGPLAARQTLTFSPGKIQYGEESVGKVAYAGQFAFDRNVDALKCFRNTSAGSSAPIANSEWVDIGDSTYPTSVINGVRPMWYDLDGTKDDWYAFLSLTASDASSFNQNVDIYFRGGFSPPVRGTPRTTLPSVGAFNMSTSSSETFSGSSTITVRTKPPQIPANQFDPQGSIVDWSMANDENHVATFISDSHTLGSTVQMWTGSWRASFRSSVDSTQRMTTQLMFRFALVEDDIDEDTINGSGLWTSPTKTDGDAAEVEEFHFVPSNDGFRIAEGAPEAFSVISSPNIGIDDTEYDLDWFVSGAVSGDSAWSDNGGVTFDRIITGALDFDARRVVVQVWAASYANVGAAGISPATDASYPSLTFSWGGETDSQIQTMIIEAKSGEILPQQDPFTTSYYHQEFEGVLLSGSGDATVPVPGTEPFRYYPLFNNQLDAENESIPPSSDIGKKAHLHPIAEGGKDISDPSLLVGSNISIVGLTKSSRVDITDDQVQIVDAFVSDGLVDDDFSFVGGSAIPPQTMSGEFTWATNNDRFDVILRVSLYALDSDDFTLYRLAQSERFLLSSVVVAGGFATFTMPVNQEILVPDRFSRLVLRFELWAFDNVNAETPIETPESDTPGSSDGALPDGFSSNYASLDLSNFAIKFGAETPLKIYVGQTTTGSNDWYQGLPVSPPRTFGGASYIFVADEDSTKTTIMPPLAASQYGYWYLYGWMFSPFWFIDMPVGGVVEIQDRAGLTAGDAVSGSGLSATERAARSLRLRTAIDTLPSRGISSTKEAVQGGGSAHVVHSNALSEGGATDTLSVIQDITKDGIDQRLVDKYARRVDSAIIRGLNPLIINMTPDDSSKRMTYGKYDQTTKFLFYESLSDESSGQAEIVMVADYDGHGGEWQNPSGATGANTTGEVVVTRDMRLIGGGICPISRMLYVAGYRATDLDSPQNGGMIVMRSLQPKIIYGTESAHAGPLFFVDGLLTDDSWNTFSVSTLGFEAQPFSPDNLEEAASRQNRSSGGTRPALESFPGVFVDSRGYIYVFYSLLSSADNAADTLGWVFCKESRNGGWWFGETFPVTSLGWNEFPQGDVGDEEFEARHFVPLYDGSTGGVILFFWAGGKVFMSPMQHPGVYSSKTNDGSPVTIPPNIYMIAGGTGFVDRPRTSGLDGWLYSNWVEGNVGGVEGEFEYNWDWPLRSDQSSVSAGNPYVLISRFANEDDIPAQRVTAFWNNKGDISLFYLDSLDRLMHKMIRFHSSQHPLVSAGLVLDVEPF